MNKAVALITAWGDFDARYPESSLEDFCRYYLNTNDTKSTAVAKSPWQMPVSTDFVLMRLVGRIYKLHSFYAAIAMDGTGINTSEEFSLLNAIDGLNEPRKTEAISKALFELSTGSDMLSRLKKIGYISEYADAEDGRSKRLKMTAKGSKALATCRKRMNLLAEMEFHDLTTDEKKLCIHLLNTVDNKFSAAWLLHKGKRFEDIYKEVTAEPVLSAKNNR
ncbi:MarR family winged helix-turn-helix transcriptional regulator [Deminuibacter soli]|uniref:MarR family transcriptional regulator n=1 Tax=Deminuibacter soli TaxID=2291815 RepID=A0A3E1NDZ8_9BACT|nr:MarR family winged helix-turn-helix transcriptional regulator [Deminuibacter soli]RFM26180.1 MarR family transcriptional regulator [Deminuibacter soli]